MVDGLDVHVDTKQLDDNLQEACDELEERLRLEFESELNRLETVHPGPRPTPLPAWLPPHGPSSRARGSGRLGVGSLSDSREVRSRRRSASSDGS